LNLLNLLPASPLNPLTVCELCWQALEYSRGAPMTLNRRFTLNDMRRREEQLAWLFVTPVVLGILIFQVYPSLFSIYISLTQWNLLTPPRFVGPRNFVDLFTNDRFFLVALQNSAVYSIGTVV